MNILFLSLVFLFSLPVAAKAGDCGADPVWQRDFSGRVVSAVWVRSIACIDGSSILTTLQKDNIVSVIGYTDGWYYVKLSNGQLGWVGQQFITMTGMDNSTNEELDQSLAMAPAKQLAPAPSVDMNYALKLKGKILLQVEEHGEAYYINFDGYRHYMKDGSAAYGIMRNLSLGITDADYSKVASGDLSLKTRLKGKIILRVEAHGEAYYISPNNLAVVYLKDGAAAYDLMRKEGLGITNVNLAKIPLK